jgi:hypothetical protein
MAGFGKTGLLAANGSVTFLAIIFQNALAAYNGNWGIADFRLAMVDWLPSHLEPIC